MSRFVSPNTAAEEFEVKPKTLREMANRHEIPFIRVGRNIRFELAELEKHFRKAADAR